jgi:hypothetical protein
VRALQPNEQVVDAFVKRFGYLHFVDDYTDACERGDQHLAQEFLWYMRDKLAQVESEQ